MPVRMRGVAAMAAFAVAAVLATTASAQKKYDPGASDSEIRIGNIMPYSGPASSYGVIGKSEAAFFNMVNAEGGINGRKINFVSYDDAYSPPKAIEQARKLVESDEVLLIFQPLGTPSNSAIMKYMNAKKVPQLFVASGGTKFGDPKNFPWTMGFQPNYQSEGRIYAKYILDHFPNSKIAVFWQNDDTGKDQFKGLKDGLGDKANMIIADKSHEVSDPSINSQIVAPRASLASSARAQSDARAQKFLRVDGVAVDPGFIMQMRPGGAAGRSNGADQLTDLHDVADLDVDLGEVAVARRQAIAMVDFNHAAIAASPSRRHHLAVRGDAHGIARRGTEVEAGMHRGAAEEGIVADTKT